MYAKNGTVGKMGAKMVPDFDTGGVRFWNRGDRNFLPLHFLMEKPLDKHLF